MEEPIRPNSTPPTHASHSTQPPDSNTSNLFPASYDGSHLPWQEFRTKVLIPHSVHIVSQAPKNRLPFELWKLIDVRNNDTSRFDKQKKEFKAQVMSGHGFGPSPLFPPNLLPPTENKSGLARCMIPRFRREPLPEHAPGREGVMYEVSLPHPGLGCGFTEQVFDPQEFAMLPHYLSVGGTNVNFETGFVSSHASIHCPFLTFERAGGAKQEHLERANNQCSITGAWCMRAIYMLYTKAYKATAIPELPTAFTCVIENSFAILNYHWIEQGRECYMAPLCKFDLKNDTHFTKFLVWIEAIGDWGLRYLLPKVKAALSRLIQFSPTPTVTAIPSLALSPTSNASSESGIVRALRTTFDSIPWRLDDGEFTPLTSSTGEWGSPRNIAESFSSTPVSRKSTHSWGSPCDDDDDYPSDFPYPSGPNINLRNLNYERQGLSLSVKRRPARRPTLVTSPPPPNPTTVLQNRLNEARCEIQDLRSMVQRQQAEHERSLAFIQDELFSVKDILLGFLRRENTRGRSQRSLSSPASPHVEAEGWSELQVRPPLRFDSPMKRGFLGSGLEPERESDTGTETETEAEANLKLRYDSVEAELRTAIPIEATTDSVETDTASEASTSATTDTEADTETGGESTTGTSTDCESEEESETVKTPTPME